MTRSYQLSIHSCGACPFAFSDANNVYRCRRSLNDERTGHRLVLEPDSIAPFCPLELEAERAHLISARNGLLQSTSALEAILLERLNFLAPETAAEWVQELESIHELAKFVATASRLAHNSARRVALGIR